MGKSVRVKSFELVTRDISDVDLNLLHGLSTAVGWPHRLADWDFLRNIGHGIVAVDGIGRVFGSAMWFPQGEDFATIGLVITSPRTQAQGAGRWLMDQVIERCACRNLSLNSTKAAFQLYLSLGFTHEATTFLHRGIVSGLPFPPSPDAALCELPADQLAEVMACDMRAFGYDRSRVLALLSEIAVTCVLRRNDKVVGYAMRRPFGGLHVIGPIVADNDEDAIQLASWHFQALQGQAARIDTREATGPFTEFLAQCGLSVEQTALTMSKGRRFLNRIAAEPWVYGLAGHALS